MTDVEGEVDSLSVDFAAATETPLLLVNAYADARNAREEAADRTKRLGAVEAACEAALFDAMEKLNLRSVQHARGRFTLNDLAWASVADEDKAREWAEAAMPELLMLNRQRLSAVVRQFLRGERDAMPPGVDYSVSRKISWRRT